MAENTKIEWCDHSWNPWVGCTKVSAACDNCYAEGWAKRAGRPVWGPHADRQRTKTWGSPIKWNKTIEGTGKRERVFVASLADVFDNHKSILPEWRAEMWELIKSCTNLDFLLLTKRPQNIAKYLPADWGTGYPNVWLGTTVENQTEAERRIPHLLRVNAAIHFLSCEPLQSELSLTEIAGLSSDEYGEFPVFFDAFSGKAYGEHGDEQACGHWIDPGIDWVISGGESGPGARPTHPDWHRSLRDQCAEAGVAFFFKQWGEWVPGHYSISQHTMLLDPSNGPKSGMVLGEPPHSPTHVHDWGDGYIAAKVGKKKAGKLLDGGVFHEFPGVAEIND
ncbi:DUF5131 family protein [Maritalea porphyrae]|uniref:DUF5131 family protein n=1 Tax=Maritalea porphyrae TaxID=880732 RepID=UPI0022AF791E|nr:phage Gp37/Gp68 family protein [Maritalea porphyrae]MCZ4270781.1 phage Gp37/Gp68 family protein [Maritalea porphyrae]